ncbi:hypothetical protein MPH_05854 [Macrophomina phaseolina MS6]|uniref:Uncharacterized protein n=1 Tax=Macrophomina phaseolina (strain MS6) TaxID=1126212 RepID=K2RQ31_MACPH|nr:hypothetical protein MPH_05854 [Macrophomina phaseolina MS6]
MAFFLTGGTGKTSRHLATFLQDAKLPFVIGSRRGAAAAPSGSEAVKFDWLDESTFKNPFEHKFPHGEKITAVYLVAPEAEEGVVFMNKFIDYSIKEHGVKRFVLLGGSTIQPGGWYVGKVWQHILDVGVDYAVLRPSWFMENLSESWGLEQVKNGQLYTACGNGKIPFISAEDIAAVAFHTLTDEKPHNTSYRILGPELLTYDDVGSSLSSYPALDTDNGAGCGKAQQCSRTQDR